MVTPAALDTNPLAQSRPPAAPGLSSEFSAAETDGATRIIMGQLSLVHDRLTLAITERDPATRKTVRAFTLNSTNPASLYALADAAARQLSPQVTPFDSKDERAVAAWGHALEESDYARLNGDYSRAVQADPEFALAWLSWAATAASHGDRTSVEKILGEAQQHANRFSNLNRTRLKLASAEFAGDRAAILAAMDELGRLLPDDADNTRAVGDQNFNARQFPAAVTAYRRLAQLTPNNPLVWNQLGYSLMYAGDYDGAISALRTYQRLAPGDVNPIDSQGDVAFAFGRFAEAERLYDLAGAKNPSFQNSAELYKAAEAHLMTADLAGADKKFEVYAAARRADKDIALPFRTAQWRFVSGRHDEAISTLERLVSGADPAFAAPQLKALALTQLAIWDLQLGRRNRALEESTNAMKLGATTSTTLIARFASEDAHTPADWAARADRMLAGPQFAQVKTAVLGYALYMSHEWQAAEPVWKQLASNSTPDDAIAPVIYGQILRELNRPGDAEPYVRLFPIPVPNGTQEFLSLAIPKIFETRAAVLAAAGKTAEADASRKVFQTLSSSK